MSIHDDETRLKTAYLLAEALAALAGDDAVQDALDRGTKLRLPNQQAHHELMSVVHKVIDFARKPNQPSLEDLVQPKPRSLSLPGSLQPLKRPRSKA